MSSKEKKSQVIDQPGGDSNAALSPPGALNTIIPHVFSIFLMTLINFISVNFLDVDLQRGYYAEIKLQSLTDRNVTNPPLEKNMTGHY